MVYADMSSTADWSFVTGQLCVLIGASLYLCSTMATWLIFLGESLPLVSTDVIAGSMTVTMALLLELGLVYWVNGTLGNADFDQNACVHRLYFGGAVVFVRAALGLQTGLYLTLSLLLTDLVITAAYLAIRYRAKQEWSYPAWTVAVPFFNGPPSPHWSVVVPAVAYLALGTLAANPLLIAGERLTGDVILDVTHRAAVHQIFALVAVLAYHDLVSANRALGVMHARVRLFASLLLRPALSLVAWLRFPVSVRLLMFVNAPGIGTGLLWLVAERPNLWIVAGEVLTVLFMVVSATASRFRR